MIDLGKSGGIPHMLIDTAKGAIHLADELGTCCYKLSVHTSSETGDSQLDNARD